MPCPLPLPNPRPHYETQRPVRYETFDPNEIRANNETQTWTLGVNWLLKGDDLKLQLDYLLTHLDTANDDQGKLVLRSQVLF